MPYPLAGVRAKLDRGQEHLETLKVEIAAYRASKPARVEIGDDPDEPGIGRGVFTVAQEPPLRLGVIAGEAIQQFRSSLDHLAYQLAILRDPSATGPNFPIFTSRQRWTQPPMPKKKSPRDLAKPFYRPADFTLIERAQPYNAPTPSDHPLAIVQTLSNLDKHESIIGRSWVWTNIEEFHDAWGDVEIIDSIQPGEAIENGTQLVRFHVRNPEMNVRVWVRVTGGVRFGKTNIGQERFVALGQQIAGLVDEFEHAISELRPT